TTAMPELKLVAIKVVGRRSELSQLVPPAWVDLVGRMDHIAHKVNPELFYGVFPESDQLNDGENGVYTYWVGTEVSQFADLPAGMTALTLPARTYATATVRGGAGEIERTYIDLFHSIREQGLATDPAAYGFERYDSRRQRVTPPYERFDYDIFKPLA
ncbi:MAG TPA: GyrI-like domain-containing protein, partial [Symbiobacteriaceae bacterium]|nr:GyrI-like domain-containing protein [Symbiobacteriaceae bacterium]